MSVVQKVVKSADGTEIFVEAAGNRSKPEIIFAHGLAGSSAHFDKLFAHPKLQKELYMIRYDTRGHGKSGKPMTEDGYKSERYAEDVSAIIKTFGLGQVFFAGWNFGASIAADICAHINPNPLLGIVYLAALPVVGPVLERVATPRALSILPGLFNNTDVTHSLHARQQFVDLQVANPQTLPFETKCQWLGAMCVQPPVVTSLVLTRSSKPQDPGPLYAMGGKGLPLLIVNGTEDAIIWGNLVEEEMKPHFTDMECQYVSKAGHAVCWEQPDKVADLLLDFVARVDEEQSLRRKRSGSSTTLVSTASKALWSPFSYIGGMLGLRACQPSEDRPRYVQEDDQQSMNEKSPFARTSGPVTMQYRKQV